MGYKGRNHAQPCLPITSIPGVGNGHSVSSQGPRCGVCSEGSTQVVSVVLRCRQYRTASTCNRCILLSRTLKQQGVQELGLFTREASGKGRRGAGGRSVASISHLGDLQTRALGTQFLRPRMRQCQGKFPGDAASPPATSHQRACLPRLCIFRID